MKIAFIGLGIMGKPMAKNLLKAGYELRIYARRQNVQDEMAAAGAVVCASAAETVEGVDLVLTMLPNSPQVKSVMLEDDRLILANFFININCRAVNIRVLLNSLYYCPKYEIA